MLKPLIKLALALSAAVLMAVSCNTSKTVVEKNGPLSVEGTYLVNCKGEKIILQGVSFGWHNAHSRFYNAGAVKTLATEWNVRVVRASLGLEPFGDYIRNPKRGMDCVTAVVDAAIDEGVYVIIDWHSHKIWKEEAKAFFDTMSEKYAGVPNVIYEIFNEPVEQSWEEVKAYSEEVIGVIRSNDPDALILVGCPHWDQDIRLVADNPIEGCGNIMYTLHFYAATHKQYLRDEGSYAISKGIPIFVSECGGMVADGNGALDYDEWNAWQTWMEDNGISWLAWSLSDKDETCSMLTPAASSPGPWSEEAVKEWGKLVRKTIQEQVEVK